MLLNSPSSPQPAGSSLTPAHSSVRRDPDAWRRLLGLVLGALVLWPLWRGAHIRPADLFDPANVQAMGHFLSGFLPPDVSPDFRDLLWQSTLQTLAIASCGMLGAWLLAVPLAYVVTAAARTRFTLHPFSRALLTILRGVPELVWALLFVRIFGLGPAAGVLALALTYGGMLAKVYADILESIPPQRALVLRHAGAPRSMALLYGLLPQASRELVSYTVYRWECAIRASVVMGFVGAGGLGQLMDQAMKMLDGGQAASILLAFMVLVLMADLVSLILRRWMDAPAQPRAWPIGWRTLVSLGGIGWGLVASYRFLELDPAPLWSADAAQSVQEFLTGFFPPDLSADWMRQIVKATWETLAMSVMGTLIAAVIGFGLALLRRQRGWMGAPLAVTLCNILRSVPEVVWATLTVLAAGLGAFAGTLALALHTAGVLGRLYGEALQNATPQPAQALRDSGAGGGMAFLYGTWPGVSAQLMSYTLYRWEMNIRMAAVLGFVGAGGLGQQLYVELSLFHQDRACTVIMAMLALSILVDGLSTWLRRRLV